METITENKCFIVLLQGWKLALTEENVKTVGQVQITDHSPDLVSMIIISRI